MTKHQPPAVAATSVTQPAMTTGERQELAKLVRLHAKNAKADAEARGAALLADAEAKLAAIYKAEDEAWADIIAEARKYLNEAQAQLAERCRACGIPDNFAPSLYFSWSSRGENSISGRRAELRKVAQTQVAARVKEASVAIDHEAERQLAQLTASGLTSMEARAFLDNMPDAEELLPVLGALELPSGQLLALEAPRPVTPAVTDDDSDRNAVTADRNKCAHCGKPISAGRGRHCSSACRQAAYRLRRRS